MSDISTLLNELSTKIPSHLLLHDERSKQFYGRDWIKDFVPAPCLVALPETVEQVQHHVVTCGNIAYGVVP